MLYKCLSTGGCWADRLVIIENNRVIYAKRQQIDYRLIRQVRKDPLFWPLVLQINCKTRTKKNPETHYKIVPS